MAADVASPLAEAVARVGDRWSLLIIDALLAGPQRFNDLQQRLAGIAPNTLSARLRRLEQHGLVVARAYSQRPPRFVYELTEPGQDLTHALRALAQWGGRHSEALEPVRHAACGTAAEARWWCPTCARPVEDEASEGIEV